MPTGVNPVTQRNHLSGFSRRFSELNSIVPNFGRWFFKVYSFHLYFPFFRNWPIMKRVSGDSGARASLYLPESGLEKEITPSLLVFILLDGDTMEKEAPP